MIWQQDIILENLQFEKKELNWKHNLLQQMKLDRFQKKL